MLATWADFAHAEPTRRWRISCTFVNSSKDDPIVFPNQPGAAHLHDFYGNVGVTAYTTTGEGLSRFASNCPNEDRSAYWVPALYRNGEKITPDEMLLYYENKSLAAGPLVAFPANFKLVLGDSKATTAAQTEQHWVWSCLDRTQFGDKPPIFCASGGIQLRAEFPNCWDGALGPDGNAAGHVTWADGLPPAGRGDKVEDPAKNACPPGYPKPLPMLRVSMHYLTGPEVGTITLSSGSVFSKHGDFINAWDTLALQSLIDRCLNQPNVDCGHLRGTTPARGTRGETAKLAQAETRNEY
ncbi:MAG: DUF1996 domain-containing protein [Pseudomonadota bacterium]|nr:DUF1996 domain-containing protein [Pseudomonadota bacterium]